MFFDKFPAIYFLWNDAAGPQRRGNSAMARRAFGNGKCGELRGRDSPGFASFG